MTSPRGGWRVCSCGVRRLCELADDPAQRGALIDRVATGRRGMLVLTLASSLLIARIATRVLLH
jgi:hypothetical protein